MINKTRVIHIIKTTPHADFLEFLLGRCNLSNKERSLIDARVAEEITQEEYAEQTERSPRHVRELEKRAFDKIIMNWSSLDWLDKL